MHKLATLHTEHSFPRPERQSRALHERRGAHVRLQTAAASGSRRQPDREGADRTARQPAHLLLRLQHLQLLHLGHQLLLLNPTARELLAHVRVAAELLEWQVLRRVTVFVEVRGQDHVHHKADSLQ